MYGPHTIPNIIMQEIWKKTLLYTSVAKARTHSGLGLQMDSNIWQRAAINELWRPGLSPVNMWHLKQ